MVTNIKEMSYGAARYCVLKELDERGPIGQLLLSYDHQLANTMMDFCDWIDRTNIAYESNRPRDIDWRKADHMPAVLMSFAEKFPFLILSASELDWNGFLSAWLAIAGEFVTIMNHHLQEPMPEPEKHKIEDIIRGCQETLQPVFTLVEFGASYLDLIKAGNELVREMKMWRQSQPSSIRLSHAYLRALGIIKDEGPDANEERGDNPPPPPQGPHCNEMNPPPHN